MTKPGHEAPELDYRATPEDPQGRLDIEAAMPTPQIDTVNANAEPSPPADSDIPEDVRPAVKIMVEDADREWDRLDKQGFRTGEQTRRDAGSAAITPEDIEKEAVAEVRKRLARSKANPSSAVHKRRAYHARF